MSGESLLGLIGQTGTYSTTGPAVTLGAGSAVTGYRTAASAYSDNDLADGQSVVVLIQNADLSSRAVWLATYDQPNGQFDRDSEVLALGDAFSDSEAVTVYVVADQLTLPLYTTAVAGAAIELDCHSQRVSYHRVTLDASVNNGGISVANVPASGVVELVVEIRQSGGTWDCPIEAWSGITGLSFETEYYLYTNTLPTVVTLRSTDGGTSWRARANAPASQINAASYNSGNADDGFATDGHVLTADGAGGAAWEAVPGGSGTVTSVAVSGSDGIEVDSGSPITASGTIALGINASTLLTHLGIEAGATADQTAQEIATAIDADATAEATLLSALGVEAGATADQTAQEIATAIDADTVAEATLRSAIGVATTSRAGLAPTLSNSATQYLNGTGNWTTPDGTGGAGSGEVEILAPALASDGLTPVALDITGFAFAATSLV